MWWGSSALQPSAPAQQVALGAPIAVLSTRPIRDKSTTSASRVSYGLVEAVSELRDQGEFSARGVRFRFEQLDLPISHDACEFGQTGKS